MARGRPFHAAKITDECFAAVIRAFMASPKFQGYSPATREAWGRELRLAERPDTLGAISVNILRPALVQAFIDALSDRPGKQAAALAALADEDYVAESAAINRSGLSHLAQALDAMQVGYVASHGNFLLIHVGAAAAVYEALLRQGVIVRPVANYGLPEHLRVTVGLPEENARFLSVLKTALGR